MGGGVKNYNKQAAARLYEELKDRVNRIPALIEQAPDDGPVINGIAEALGAAISALKDGPPRRD
jgi:hypothetical protein